MRLLIGDVHGDIKNKKTGLLNIEAYTTMCESLPEHVSTVQVGDLGYGFLTVQRTGMLDDWFAANPRHKFIRGNHDKLLLCKQSPGFIDDGTYDPVTKTLFIGGAESTDKARRTEGVSWWDDEQVSYERFCEILDMDIDVRTVVAHDLPLSQVGAVCRGTVLPNVTRHGLQQVFEKFKPNEWFCGHYHVGRIFLGAADPSDATLTTVFQVLPESKFSLGDSLTQPGTGFIPGLNWNVWV